MSPLLLISAMMVAFLAATGCSSGKSSTLVVLDEAFRAIRPDLSASLSRLDTAGKLPGRKIAGGEYSYGDGTEALAKDIAAAKKRAHGVGLLVASPLVAARAGILPAGVPLVVVDGPAPSGPGILSVKTDRARAYRAAGRAAGIYLASLPSHETPAAPHPAMPSASSPAEIPALRPGCGIVFAPSFSRQTGLIAEFEAGYREGWAEASGPAPASGPPPVFTEMVSTAGAADPNKASIDFVDSAGETDAAVKKLLEHDLKVIFFACGRIQEAFRTASEHPDIIVGLDEIGSDPLPGMAFRIVPDEKAIAKAVAALRGAILSGRENGDSTVGVPALLVPGAKKDLERGGVSFGAALKKAKKAQ